MISEAITQYPWLWALAWQSTICLAAGLAGSYLYQRRPARAHRILLLGLMAAAIIPVMSQVVRQKQWGLFVAERAVSQSQQYSLPRQDDIVVPAAPTTSETTRLSRPQRPEAMPVPKTVRFKWTQAIMPLWLVASSVLLLRLAMRFLLAWRLVKRSAPIEGTSFGDTIEAAKDRLGIRTSVVVRAAGNTRSPVIWCWGRRPTLLIPARSRQDNAELDWISIICHELAHWKQRDHVNGLLAELMVCILPWQPLAWWTCRRLVALSEEACDDWVIASGQRATAYARTLLGLGPTPQGQASLVPGVVVGRRGLAGRVRRILHDGCGNPHPGLYWTAAVLALAGCLVLGLAFAQTRPARQNPQVQSTDAPPDAAAKPENEVETCEDGIRLRLVDTNGEPVPGARAARTMTIREDSVLGSRFEWYAGSSSDANGQVILSAEELFRFQDETAVYILHEDRWIGGVQEIDRSDANRPPYTMLHPVCRVRGTLRSSGLEALGMALQWANLYVDSNGHALLNRMFQEQKFDFELPLPAGEYRLLAYGASKPGRKPEHMSADTKHQILPIKVPDGLPELDLGVIELPPTKLSTMIGQPAPELGPIKAWQNGAPVSLRALRGQVVLLFFDGDHPNTSRDLPQLVKLHEAMGDKGLTIISLYNCESLEELDRRWKETYERFGGVTEVPFRIAIDGGEQTRYETTDKLRAGATYERYDITGDPTSVLIDPAGNVVGQPNLFYLKEIIAPMLGVREEELLPAWRQRFNEVYRLEEGEILKRIAPPFIPERMDYYRNEHEHQAQAIPRGPEEMTFHWDGKLKNWGMSFGRFSRLDFVLNRVAGLKRYEYEGPKPLLDLESPGDWIIRDEVPQDMKLQALSELIAREFNREIWFERRTVERSTIVATGRFRFHPPVGTYENTAVHLWAEESDADEGAGGGTADSIQEFLQMLGDRVNVPVLDWTEPGEQVRIPYRHHRSSRVGRIPDEQERARQLGILLDHLTAQTESQFEIRTQPAEIWLVAEKDDSR